MTLLRALDAVYTTIMLTFWYGLFFGVWPALILAAIIWRVL